MNLNLENPTARETLEKEISDPANPELKGPVFEIVSRLIRTLSARKVGDRPIASALLSSAVD